MSPTNEMTNDEKVRRGEDLIRSYKSLIEQEIIARRNNDEKHLKACLDAQKRVIARINRLMPPGNSKSKRADTAKLENQENTDLDKFSLPAPPKIVSMVNPFFAGFQPFGLPGRARVC